MGSKMRRIADASKGKILSMERRLSGVFKPIKPRQEFVHDVAQHITTTPRVTLVDRITDWHLLALLIALLVSIAVFLSLIWRALLSLLGRKKTAHV